MSTKTRHIKAISHAIATVDKRTPAIVDATSAELFKGKADQGKTLVVVELDPFKLALQEQKALDELESLDGQTIESDADAAAADAYLVERMREAKALEALRAAAVAPLNEEHARIQAMFNPVVGKGGLYAQIREKVGGMLGAYLLAKQQAKEAALRALQAAADNATPKQLTAALAKVDAAEVPTLGGTTAKGVWVAFVEDEGCVPRAYMSPDPRKLAAYVKNVPAHERPAVLSGIRFALVAQTRVRTS